VINAKLQRIMRLYTELGSGHPEGWAQIMVKNIIIEEARYVEKDRGKLMQELFMPEQKFIEMENRLDVKITFLEKLKESYEKKLQKKETFITEERAQTVVNLSVPELEEKKEEDDKAAMKIGIFKVSNIATSDDNIEQKLFDELRQHTSDKERKILETVRKKLERIRSLYAELGVMYSEGWPELMVNNMIRDEVCQFQNDREDSIQEFLIPEQKFENMEKRLNQRIILLIKLIESHKKTQEKENAKEEGSEASRIVEQQETRVEKLEREQDELESDVFQAQQSLASLPPPPQLHSRAISDADRVSFFTNSESSVVRTPGLTRRSLTGSSSNLAIGTPATPSLSRRSLGIKIGLD
jgi:hypothetical protein